MESRAVFHAKTQAKICSLNRAPEHGRQDARRPDIPVGQGGRAVRRRGEGRGLQPAQGDTEEERRSHQRQRELPYMKPTICIVNFDLPRDVLTSIRVSHVKLHGIVMSPGDS